MINITWEEARDYASWLSGQTGKRYRLPSEAEWEYAARAGTATAYYWGNEISRGNANYGKEDCCEGLASGPDRWETTAPVSSFPANPWGLSDMAGNVWEWLQDCYDESYRGAPDDGAARTSCTDERRVLRGGSWDNSPQYLRSAFRGRISPASRHSNIGVRLAQDLDP